MRIAYVVEQFPRLSESFIQREVDALRELGHNVLVWPLNDKSKPLWKGANQETPFTTGNNLTLKAVRVMRRHPVLALRYARRVAKAARTISPPQLVHAHFASITAVCAQALASLWEVPLTVSIHARDIFVPWTPGLQATASAIKLFACSEAAVARTRELFPAKAEQVLLMHHGLPDSTFANPRAEYKDTTVLAAGRFVPKKGFEDLLVAMAILKNKEKIVKLRLVGDGPLLKKLQSSVKSLRIQDRVKFLGMLSPDDLFAQMRKAAVFCAPSIVAADGDRDGIPNVILEAMAAGLPVIACDAGGISEVVIDGKTGRLFPLARPDLLANAISSSLAAKQESLTMAQNARALVRQEFSLKENVECLAGVFEGIINSV